VKNLPPDFWEKKPADGKKLKRSDARSGAAHANKKSVCWKGKRSALQPKKGAGRLSRRMGDASYFILQPQGTLRTQGKASFIFPRDLCDLRGFKEKVPRLWYSANPNLKNTEDEQR
jgi:hypothetical protein